MAGRKLIVEIVGDSSSLERTLSRSTKATRNFSVSMGTIFKSAVGFAAVTEGFEAVGDAVRAGIGEFSDAAKVAAQTSAELKSTGGVANVTARQVANLAGEISNLSGIDDEAVQAGENMILTFKNVRNEVGKGNAIFDRAARAAVNLSVAGFGSITDTAKQLGKALNDPVRGMTALGRSGVTFTEAQRKQIKGLVESGRLLEAQKVLLAEVESQVGGSARALGETLPGKLNIAKERLKDVAGELVGAFVPAFAKGAGAVADFAKRIAAAQGVRAKIKVVFEGIESIGRQLFNQIADAIRQVDFADAVATVQDGLLRGIRSIAGFIDRVNWSEVGRAISNGLVRAIQGVQQFLENVDWGQVGRKIVKGIADFLKAVNWKAVAVGTIKLLVAALKGTASLLVGAGAELGKQAVRAIKAGVEALGRAVEAAAIKIVLRVVKALDFKILGHTVIPGIDGIVKRLEAKLDELAQHAEKTGTRVQKALEKAAGSVNRSAAIPTEKPRAKPSTANDATVKQAADAAKAAAAQQAAAAQKAAKVASDAAEKQRKAFATLIEKLQLGVDRAGLTKALNDDLAALEDLRAGLEKQVKAGTDVVSAQSQLVSVAEQIKAKQAEIRERARDVLQARQFRGLGLSASGGEIIPGVDNLKKQLAQLSARLGADAAPKLKSQLSRIAKVLAGGFGKVTLETRAKIKELFDTIRDTFKDQADQPLTKTTSLKAAKLLEGLGLGPDAIRELRSRLSKFNSAGVGFAPRPGTVGAFGRLVPAGAGGPIVIHNQLDLDGKTVARSTRTIEGKRTRRNPPQKRGPLAGRI